MLLPGPPPDPLGARRDFPSTVVLHRAICPHLHQGPCGSRPVPRWTGEVEGGSGKRFYVVLHKETWPTCSQILTKSVPTICQHLWKSMGIRPGRSLVMIASQQPYCNASLEPRGSPRRRRRRSEALSRGDLWGTPWGSPGVDFARVGGTICAVFSING